jgi:hypothetical protein
MKKNEWMQLIFVFLSIKTISVAIGLIIILSSEANLKEGFYTPVIALEFAKSAKDLDFLSGNQITNKMNREKMHTSYQLDMLFPFTYACLIALILICNDSRRKNIIRPAGVATLVIIPFDISENLVILEILSNLNNALPIDYLLLELNYWTWLKWGAISVSFVFLSIHYQSYQKFKLAIFCYLAALCIFIAYTFQEISFLLELMSLMTGALLLTLCVIQIAQALIAESRETVLLL